MKSLLSSLMFLSFLLVEAVVFGCACHPTPAGVQSPHGGLLAKTSKDDFVELVQEGAVVRVYLYTHELQPVPVSAFSIKAKIQVPGEQAAKELPVTQEQGFYSFNVQVDESVHRYTVLLELTRGNESETIDFLVEPQGDFSAVAGQTAHQTSG